LCRAKSARKPLLPIALSISQPYSWRSPLLASAIGHPKFGHSGPRFAMHEALSNCGIMEFGNTRRFFFFAA
jgi:hypothetical protein